MNIWTIAGILLVAGAIIGIGIYSGSKIRDSGDFLSGGGKAGTWLVCGAIMGSLVSSQATIGTAQLAFHYGLSAWWFTLGGGIGCLFLALFYIHPLRNSHAITELQIISDEYGTLAGTLGSALCSTGIFISILAQVVACGGLMSVLFPLVPAPVIILITVLLMSCYVLFGGAWGAGMGGILKLLLLYISSILCMVVALALCKGQLTEVLSQALCRTPLGMIQEQTGYSVIHTVSDLNARFFNLTARGKAKDLGSGISLLLGVLSTQTYAQGIWSGKSDSTARKGALLGAFLTPPLGIAGICIGIFMRSHYMTQAEADALLAAGIPLPSMEILSGAIQAFPMFALRHLPPLPAGIILGTLLITIVGGGAGLTLGMATILVKDIYQPVTGRREDPKNSLIVTRVFIGLILAAAGILAAVVSGSLINDMGFLSMGLRGTTVFLPLCGALWLKGKVNRRCILASVVLSPLSVLLGKMLHSPIDPLFVGLAVSFFFFILGIMRNKLLKGDTYE